MEKEYKSLEGAKYPSLIRRWLKSRDRGWELVDSMRSELKLRQYEDYKEGRNWKRFDGVIFEYEEDCDKM
jgi:hypothetical protein